MAELIGVLSSGAGIASLAIQISQQVREMKDFVRCLKSAPEDINSLVNEISILNELLFTSASSFELHSDTGDRCGQLCRKAAEFLSDSLKVSQQKLDRQKLWGRIEFVLKRGDLEKCVGKLERTRNMLQFAHLYVMILYNVAAFRFSSYLFGLFQSILFYLDPPIFIFTLAQNSS